MKISKAKFSIRYLTALFISTSLFSFGTLAPANANDVGAEIMHTIECVGLLISDPARHLEECGVGDLSSSPVSNFNRSAVQPPEPPPECQSECEV